MDDGGRMDANREDDPASLPVVPQTPDTTKWSPVPEYRASFDAVANFSNGGDLTVHGFRVDVPSADVDEAEIAALFVASLGLLMTESVRLSQITIFAEPHKGTRGGPSDRSIAPAASGQLVELSHVIRAGMITYPGLPGPAVTPYLTREDSREHAPGAEFLGTDKVVER
jgi:arylformamidase